MHESCNKYNFHLFFKFIYLLRVGEGQREGRERIPNRFHTQRRGRCSSPDHDLSQNQELAHRSGCSSYDSYWMWNVGFLRSWTYGQANLKRSKQSLCKAGCIQFPMEVVVCQSGNQGNYCHLIRELNSQVTIMGLRV